MKFLVDQDVYQVTVALLNNLNHDVVRARDVGLEQAPDKVLLEYAHRTERILVTRDKGFSTLFFLFREKNCGCILLRMHPFTIEEVHRQLALFLERYAGADLKNRFVVVESQRYRVRILK